jgi:hypothetical protein
MFQWKGEDVDGAFLAIDAAYDDPYHAVEAVFIAGEPMPLPEKDRVQFITDNHQSLVWLCEEAHLQWVETQPPQGWDAQKQTIH